MDHATLQQLECVAEVRAPAEPESRTFPFVCSTESEDSHGSVILQDWDLARYRANPVVFLNHAASRDLPIGKASNVEVRDGKLQADITIVADDAHPMAPFVAKQLRDRTLRGCSVGFLPRDYRFEMRDERDVLVFANPELVELSIVGVPSNADCLMRLRSVARERTAGSRGPAAPPSNEDNMTDKPSKVLVGAARMGLPADSEERAADAVLARAEQLAEVCRTIGLPAAASAADITARVAELATRAAQLPKLEAELRAAREVEEKRAKAERAAHIDALIAAKPELGEAREALEAFAAADYDAFARRYPKPANSARERALTSQVIPPAGSTPAPLAERLAPATGTEAMLDAADQMARELMAKNPSLGYRAAFKQAGEALGSARRAARGA